MSENNYVQVEIPKVPRYISDVLDRYKTRDYNSFKLRVKYDITLLISEQYKWTLDNRKKIDLAIALGVWQIEKDV